MKPTDQEMNTIVKIVGYSQFPRVGDTPCHAGPYREAPNHSGGRGNERDTW